MEQPEIVVRIDVANVGGPQALVQLVSELCTDVCAAHDLAMEGSADPSVAELFFKGATGPVAAAGRTALTQWFADRGLVEAVEILGAPAAPDGAQAA